MRRRLRRKWVLIAAALAAMAGLVGWVLAGDLGGSSSTTELLAATPMPRPTTTAEPTGTPSPSVVTAAPARLLIPKIGVDAPVTPKGLRPDGFMDTPDGPEDVAWYVFSARPGMTGNAVLSGHLDYHDYGAAVFWRLKELQQGDLISLKSSYDARTAPVPEIIGPTSREVVTLITCGGTFDSGSRSYSNRLVVRADRV
jgi:sortase (surface protein transpeptidase)